MTIPSAPSAPSEPSAPCGPPPGHPPLDPTAAGVLAALPRAPGWWETLDVVAQRLAWRERSLLDVPGLPMRTSTELLRGRAGHRIPVRWYLPPDRAPGCPGIVYLHGGGWAIGDLEMGDAPARRLAAATGAVVASLDYRLAPEHPYPAAVFDVLDALDALAERAPTLGVDAGRLVLAGESAGATLAGAVAATVTAVGSRRSGPLPAALCLWYPGLLIDPEPPSMGERWRSPGLPPDAVRAYRRLYLGERSGPLPPSVSPWYTVDLGNFPPTVVAVAGYDPVHDDGVLFAERLRAAGVPTTLLQYPALPHAFCTLTCAVPAAAAAVDETATALLAMLGAARP